jgi:hypothetical protein
MIVDLRSRSINSLSFSLPLVDNKKLKLFVCFSIWAKKKNEGKVRE